MNWQPTHRDELPIPEQLETRKDWLCQLREHKIWDKPWVLHDGRIFQLGDFEGNVHIDLQYIDPTIGRINSDDSLNTKTEIWIEAGPPFDLSTEAEGWAVPEEGWTNHNRWMRSHDIRLDCGAETLEEALLRLYSLVQLHYHDDGSSKELYWCGWKDRTYDRKCSGEEFCDACGFRIQPEETD